MKPFRTVYLVFTVTLSFHAWTSTSQQPDSLSETSHHSPANSSTDHHYVHVDKPRPRSIVANDPTANTTTVHNHEKGELRRMAYAYEILSEFEYGQRALYGEPCDYDIYVALVLKPIFIEGVAGSNDPSRYKTWVQAQHDYSRAMQKNRTLRSLTCHADHLMQCSTEKNNVTGKNTCECLQLPPCYNLTIDDQTGQCRAMDGTRCYSPFGFYCLTGSVCRQTAEDSGECRCVKLTDGKKLKDNCSGYKEDFEPESSARMIIGEDEEEVKPDKRTHISLFGYTFTWPFPLDFNMVRPDR